MATITLFANRVNNMPELFNTARNSVSSFREELESLRLSALGIDSSVCDLDATISSLRTSTDTQEAKITALESVKGDAEVFASETVTIDEAAAEAITSSKDDFYDTYDYMKPDSEKSGWEQFKEAFGSVTDFVKDNWWKIVIGLVVIAVGAVLTALTGGTFLAAFLVALKAAAIAGLIGGAISAGISLIGSLIRGESFGTTMGHMFRAFGDGFASGFMWGGIFAGASQILGSGLRIAFAKAPDAMGKLMTQNGKISEFLLKRMVPAGAKNQFVPNARIPEGFKYDISINRIFGNSTSFQLKWHCADAQWVGVLGSNSGAGWTAQIKSGNKFLTTLGTIARMNNSNINSMHIPLIRWRWF